LARPEAEPSTPLAWRLRDIRRTLGFNERKQFAEYLGISASTLGGYETGVREPTVSAIEVYKVVCGASLDWIITGEGEMFTGVLPSAPTVQIDVMARIATRVEATFKRLEKKPAEAFVTTTAAEIYNELLTAKIDFDDPDELEPAIAVQIAKLKKRILSNPNDPAIAVA